MKITVVLEPSEEGGYTVYAPSLPGCISEGDSKDEALQNIKEAIELYLVPVEDDTSYGPDSEISEDLKSELMERGEATELFAQPHGDGLASICYI